jgi:hypothetical protein
MIWTLLLSLLLLAAGVMLIDPGEWHRDIVGLALVLLAGMIWGSIPHDQT